ncbi:Putative DNA processing chain A [Olavius sp. associated proteobacterium Delta 1]|nr:Putative DNA processing chain A [Olavius sp. associated proteobacterium Delta 1]
MPYALNIIETGSPDYPQPLKITDNSARYPQIWTIGNLEILNKKLLGFFCSVKCPGDIILKTYDLARALRDAGITLTSGFHSPIEKDVFDLLLRGSQPIVVCPARSIENMRIPNAWKEAIDSGRLLVLSPFEKKHKRVTASLSEQHNRIVALLARAAFIPYAAPGSRSENLCKGIIRAGKRVFTCGDESNQSLFNMGAKLIKVAELEKQ